jgi:hypothetical protein
MRSIRSTTQGSFLDCLEEVFMPMQLSNLRKCGAVFSAITVIVAACAANPVADEKIAVAKASVQRAEQAGAPESAPVVLATARNELTGAEKANAAHDMPAAAQLAEKANVDAQVAEATAQQQRAQKAAAEFDASMQALRQESLPKSAAPQ